MSRCTHRLIDMLAWQHAQINTSTQLHTESRIDQLGARTSPHALYLSSFGEKLVEIKLYYKTVAPVYAFISNYATKVRLTVLYHRRVSAATRHIARSVSLVRSLLLPTACANDGRMRCLQLCARKCSTTVVLLSRACCCQQQHRKTTQASSTPHPTASQHSISHRARQNLP